MNRIQSVLRSAARLVLRKRKFDPVSIDLRKRLHWLPIRQKIQARIIGLQVFAWSGSQTMQPDSGSILSFPTCLHWCRADPYSCRLQSAAHGDLTVPVPWTRTVRMGLRSFAVSEPELIGTGTKTSQHFTCILQIPAKD